MIRHTFPVRIGWGDCDPAQIVFYPNYFAWFDQGAHLLFDHLGLPMGQLAEDYGVVGLPIVDAKAKFLRPSKYWDKIEVTSWVSEVREKTLVVSHEVRNTGQLAVEGSEVRVWATVHPEDSNRLQAMAIPEVVRRQLLASEGESRLAQIQSDQQEQSFTGA